MLHGLEETPAWPLLRTLGQLPSRAGCCTTEGSCGKKCAAGLCSPGAQLCDSGLGTTCSTAGVRQRGMDRCK